MCYFQKILEQLPSYISPLPQRINTTKQTNKQTSQFKYIPGNETFCLCVQNVSWYGFKMYLYHSRVLFRSITIYEYIIFQERNANQNLVRKQHCIHEKLK